ncbi:MAG: hypothetical protein V3V75_01985, partial [Thermoguttaceae bacterium]
LFRTDGSESVDNYNTFVKPRMNQQNQNAMAGGQIRSLQNRTQNQGGAIQRIGSQTQALQGRSNHNYFMNRGGYYPGSRR